MRLDEFRVVRLDPVGGSEAAGARPAVVVSNDGANAAAARLGRGVVTVLPVTSNIDVVYPFQVLLPAAETGLDADSKTQAEQIRSIAVGRFGTTIGYVPLHLMAQIDDAIRLHLDL